MNHIKMRLLAVVLILLSAGLVYYNWQQLTQKGDYSQKLAAFAPLCLVGGFYLLIFPSKGGKPETTGEKFLALIVFVVGLAAGLINWYLMDPGFFGK